MRSMMVRTWAHPVVDGDNKKEHHKECHREQERWLKSGIEVFHVFQPTRRWMSQVTHRTVLFALSPARGSLPTAAA